MKQNVKCTMEDIINLLKEKYRKEGVPMYVDTNTMTMIGICMWQMMNGF